MLQLTVPIGAADPEPYEDALLAAGAVSITLEDAADDPVLEPAPGETPLWPTVKIRALFDPSHTPDSITAALRAQIPDAPAPSFETLADRAWEREWLKDFRPMQFGRRLWICPGGQRPPADATAAASDASPCIVELDPGLAFGTGTHPTTALCLEWLDSAELAGARVIDYGCGSGILAIAALKLGAQSALGVDIDPQALLATRENARRNNVADRLTVFEHRAAGAGQLASAPIAQSADVLLANILAGPLESLAPVFAGLVREGGRIVLSGVLREQAESVASCYAPWFDMSEAMVRDEWARLDGVRRPLTNAC